MERETEFPCAREGGGGQGNSRSDSSGSSSIFPKIAAVHVLDIGGVTVAWVARPCSAKIASRIGSSDNSPNTAHQASCKPVPEP